MNKCRWQTLQRCLLPTGAVRSLQTPGLRSPTSEVLEKTLESPVDCKETKPANPKGNQLWIFIGKTGAAAEVLILRPSDEELTHWTRWCWERMDAKGGGGDRGWDSWMASLTQWTWIWANCGRWWWTGEPGVLQSMGVQTDTATWLNNNHKTWGASLQGPTVLSLQLFFFF